MGFKAIDRQRAAWVIGAYVMVMAPLDTRAEPLFPPGALAQSVVIQSGPVVEPVPGCQTVDAEGGALGERVEVAAIEAADQIRLSDGRHIRLAFIAAPRDPLAGPRPDAEAEARARDHLSALVAAAREIRFVALEEAIVDRHGRAVGRLVARMSTGWTDIGLSLVRQGAARFAPAGARTDRQGSADDDCLRALRFAEADARQARRGLFAEAAFAARLATAADLTASAGAVITVEGRVLSLGHAGRTTYVNFGDRYQRDFTAWLSDKDRATWLKSGVDVAAWVGQWVRLTGTLGVRDGGSMRLVDPWQAERIASPETTEAGPETTEAGDEK